MFFNSHYVWIFSFSLKIKSMRTIITTVRTFLRKMFKTKSVSKCEFEFKLLKTCLRFLLYRYDMEMLNINIFTGERISIVRPNEERTPFVNKM